MAEVIKMPKLSDTMTDGVVAKWHKKIGDTVKSGELLADIETDKATMEFESYFDGVLLYIGVENGKAAPVDSVLAIIGKAGEDVSALTKSNGTTTTKEVVAEPAKENKTADATTVAPKIPSTVNIIRMPKLSDTMTDGVVAKWHKKKGDKVKSGELLADIETDKATMEFESYYDGVLLHIGVEAGKGAPVDSILAIIGNGTEDVTAIVNHEKENGVVKVAEAKTETPKKENSVVITQPVKEEAPVFSNSTGRVIASPLAKRIAKEKGIDIAAVRGSGDFGRIIKKDVESYTTSQKSGSGSYATKPFVAGKESYTEESVSQMRKVIAKRLTDSKNSAPHFYLTIDVNMENAIAARTAINELGEVKTSYNDLVVKACAFALRRHPKVNSAWMGDKLRFNDHIHIGIAVAIEDGLLVPVVRFADQKTLPQIALEIKDLGKRAKERKLQPADWEGNTFTVSNLGMFGVEEFTSIINTPEACILAVGAIRNIPVVKNGMVVPGNMMKMTLSCDHRVVDGATGAAFLQTLKQTIENPVVMFV